MMWALLAFCCCYLNLEMLKVHTHFYNFIQLLMKFVCWMHYADMPTLAHMLYRSNTVNIILESVVMCVVCRLQLLLRH